ncbi:MAG: acetyltransferase [Actinomycetota bacterium]
MTGSPLPIVVFGLNDFASLAHFYLRHDSDREVVAFTAHADYVDTAELEGKPVVAFEELTDRYPPGAVELLAPMAPRRANGDRQAVYEQGLASGYDFASYVSTRATTFPDFIAGPNCFILEDSIVQPFVRIGANVILWSGSHIGHHGTVDDHVFLAPKVVVSGHCRIGANAYLGVNSTVRDGTVVGEGSMIGMGANVTRNTEPWSVNVGNPAKPTGGDAREVAV